MSSLHRLSPILLELFSHGLDSHRVVWDFLEAVASTRDNAAAKAKGCVECLCVFSFNVYCFYFLILTCLIGNIWVFMLFFFEF